MYRFMLCVRTDRIESIPQSKPPTTYKRPTPTNRSPRPPRARASFGRPSRPRGGWSGPTWQNWSRWRRRISSGGRRWRWRAWRAWGRTACGARYVDWGVWWGWVVVVCMWRVVAYRARPLTRKQMYTTEPEFIYSKPLIDQTPDFDYLQVSIITHANQPNKQTNASIRGCLGAVFFCGPSRPHWMGPITSHHAHPPTTKHKHNNNNKKGGRPPAARGGDQDGLHPADRPGLGPEDEAAGGGRAGAAAVPLQALPDGRGAQQAHLRQGARAGARCFLVLDGWYWPFLLRWPTFLGLVLGVL